MINYSVHKLLSGIRMIIIFAIAYNYNNFILANNSDSQIGVTIFNSYSASIAWGPSANVIPSGGYYWSSGTQTFINVSASTGSSYTLYGGSTALTGIGTGSYTNTELIVLGSGDYSTSFQADFLRDFEPYSSNVLELRIDRTPPPIPVIISPLDNTIVLSNSPLTIAWSNSIDSGIGTIGYWLHLSLHPSFIGESVIWVTGTGTQLAPNSLPLGTMYRYVEAVDGLGNSSQSSAGFFHYTTGSILSTGTGGGGTGGGGGVGITIIQDNCPNGDFSPSYYDNICGSAPTQTGTITTGTNGTSGVTTTGGANTGVIIGTGASITGDNSITPETLGGNQSGDNQIPPKTTTLKDTLIQGGQKAQSIKPIRVKAPSIYRKYNNINTITNPYVYKSLLNTYWKGNYLIGVDYNMVYLSRIVVACIQLSMRINTLLHFIVKHYTTYKKKTSL